VAAASGADASLLSLADQLLAHWSEERALEQLLHENSSGDEFARVDAFIDEGGLIADQIAATAPTTLEGARAHAVAMLYVHGGEYGGDGSIDDQCIRHIVRALLGREVL